MTESNDPMTGHCLCGAVSFEVQPKELHADVCHCSMCRRWSGGPAFAVTAEGPPDVTGREHVSVFKSSAWGERHFCKTCGTNLFWSAPEYGYFGVAAGSLADADLARLTFAKQIFIDKKPALYEFANTTNNMTEAEFLAMFASADGKSDPQDS